MILGIDASNIRGGGGITHLVELLRAADPIKNGFSKVIIWSGEATLNKIEDRPWLIKSNQSMLNKSFFYRTYWQCIRLSKLARVRGCNLLFVPGGSYCGDFQPMVTLSQNLLPFEWRELRRFGLSWMTLKLILLRFTQSRTFRKADGLIFLSRYAQHVVTKVIKASIRKIAIVPHGIDERFFRQPREQLSISQYDIDHPYRILYVSIVDMYKHQWMVAQAVAQLRKSGLPIILDFVGPAYPPALKKLRNTLNLVDPSGEFVRYLDTVPYAKLHTLYAQADLCLFASSCENMPNILLEGMASGLPIACSNCGPMPEMLGDAGVYFDPENRQEIIVALQNLIDSPELRSQMAMASFVRSKRYSWAKCAGETFEFMAAMANDFNRDKKAIKS